MNVVGSDCALPLNNVAMSECVKMKQTVETARLGCGVSRVLDGAGVYQHLQWGQTP